ncbi:hypothetical protein ONZ45_g17580 [Pleurotus djamor]|nr:hypothetical protein ONZ45_g17580 [Pleurotus djamor]
MSLSSNLDELPRSLTRLFAVFSRPRNLIILNLLYLRISHPRAREPHSRSQQTPTASQPQTHTLFATRNLYLEPTARGSKPVLVVLLPLNGVLLENNERRGSLAWLLTFFSSIFPQSVASGWQSSEDTIGFHLTFSKNEDPLEFIEIHRNFVPPNVLVKFISNEFLRELPSASYTFLDDLSDDDDSISSEPSDRAVQQSPPEPSTPLPSTMAARPTSFPQPGERTAPSFDGSPDDLERFFLRIEALTPEGATNRLIIDACISYLSQPYYNIFRSCPKASSANGTWDTFKEAVYKLYPGSKNGSRYTRGDLLRIASARAATPMRSHLDLGTYQCSFLPAANWLLEHHEISETDVGTIFIRGMDPELKREVHRRLIITLHDHHPNSPYSFKDIREAAAFVLGGGPVEEQSSQFESRPMESNQFDSPPAVKQEDAGVSKLTAMLETLLNNQAKLVAQPPPPPTFPPVPYPYPPPPTYPAYSQPPPAFAQTYAANRPAPFANPPLQDASAPFQSRGRAQGPRTNPGCHFCGHPSHSQNFCEVARDYTQRGLVAKNAYGKWILPTGQQITREIPGEHFKDQIDNWLRSNPPPPSGNLPPPPPPPPPAAQNVASTNYISAFMLEGDKEDLGEIDLATLENDSQFAEIFLKKVQEEAKEALRKKVRFTEPSTRVTRSAAAKEATTSQPPAHAPVPASTSADDSIAKAIETGSYPNRNQYRLQSAIEDSAVPSAVLERALETPVTITQREFLALSFDARRALRELITSKRVNAEAPSTHLVSDALPFASVNLNSAVQQNSSPFDFEKELHEQAAMTLMLEERQSMAVAEPIQPLQVIYPVFEDTCRAECILDEGSQIVAMRRDVWESICVGINLDRGMMMESANNSTSNTIGLAKNVKMSIAGIDFYLQIQIVEDAPYEVLLGRPFHCYANATSRHFPDGRQDLIMLDPHTGDRIMVPTQERVRKRAPTPTDKGATSFQASRNL